jgi:mannose-6-phosphate isomerase-like protein (cupin superfamily)
MFQFHESASGEGEFNHARYYKDKEREKERGMTMPHFHLHPLPDNSTLLMGPAPRDEFGFVSEHLQIWYNNTATGWVDSAPHAHAESDECFVVLRGQLLVEVEGKRFLVGPRAFCCFPRGVYHAVIETYPPVESLMIRAPAVNDKQYQEPPSPLANSR